MEGKLAPMSLMRRIAALSCPALLLLIGCKIQPLMPTHIVFTSDRSGSLQVYLMEVNGANVTLITNPANANHDASMSAAGTKIIYTSTRSSNEDIWINNNLGTNEQRRTTDMKPDYSGMLNRNGNRIVFVSKETWMTPKSTKWILAAATKLG